MTALPGDRDVQVERIAAVLTRILYGTNLAPIDAVPGLALTLAPRFYDAGLRAVRDDDDLGAAWREAEAALPDGRTPVRPSALAAMPSMGDAGHSATA